MTSQPNSGTLRALEAEPPIECGLTCRCAEQCEYVAVGLELAAAAGNGASSAAGRDGRPQVRAGHTDRRVADGGQQRCMTTAYLTAGGRQRLRVGSIVDMGLSDVATLVGASAVSAVVGWVASASRAKLVTAWKRLRAKRRCARGRHDMHEWERRVVHDESCGPRGPTELILIGCRWCGSKDVMDADVLWDC